MRIRTVFLLGFLAVALPGLGVTAWRAAEAWGAARQAERAILATRAVAALQRAQTAFSAQIGQLLAAAQAPTPDLEDTRRTGAVATALLAEGTAAATAAGLPASLPEEASRTAATLLRRVEAAAAQPDPTLVRDIAIALGGFGDRLGQLTQEAGRGLGLAASFRQWNLPGVVVVRDATLEAALLTGEARLASRRWLLAGLLALILGLLGLAGAAVTVLLRRVVRPHGALTGAVPRIAGGTLDLTVPGRGRRDGLGEMAAAVERLRAERLGRDAAQATERTAQLARTTRVDGLLRGFEAETAGALHAAAALDTTANGMAATAADGTSRTATVAGAAGGRAARPVDGFLAA